MKDRSGSNNTDPSLLWLSEIATGHSSLTDHTSSRPAPSQSADQPYRCGIGAVIRTRTRITRRSAVPAALVRMARSTRVIPRRALTASMPHRRDKGESHRTYRPHRPLQTRHGRRELLLRAPAAAKSPQRGQATPSRPKHPTRPRQPQRGKPQSAAHPSGQRLRLSPSSASASCSSTGSASASEDRCAGVSNCRLAASTRVLSVRTRSSTS
jgi:hypothetical protein